ncbi:5' nucleotidase, deoxy (Pyrimidine), cytosolic type C protein (NT5C) [compost metagenome]
MDFWDDDVLYDEMVPLDGAVDALRVLSKKHEIVFVSKITGSHFQSKVEFIERFFPFAHGFIGTSEKYYAGVDVLIDDRVDHLNKAQQYGIQPIQFMTPYLQDEAPAVDMPFIKSWTDVLCVNPNTLYNALFTNIRKAL